MRILLSLIMVFSMSLVAESWFGYCTVEIEGKKICSEAQKQQGDFSPICDAFMREEGASYWRAHFATSIDHLQRDMARRCDIVRQGNESSMYACLLGVLCAGQEQPEIKHVASRVYERNEEDAINQCLIKEEWHYHRELIEQSIKGCFVSVEAQRMN